MEKLISFEEAQQLTGIKIATWRSWAAHAASPRSGWVGELSFASATWKSSSTRALFPPCRNAGDERRIIYTKVLSRSAK